MMQFYQNSTNVGYCLVDEMYESTGAIVLKYPFNVYAMYQWPYNVAYANQHWFPYDQNNSQVSYSIYLQNSKKLDICRVSFAEGTGDYKIPSFLEKDKIYFLKHVNGSTVKIYPNLTDAINDTNQITFSFSQKRTNWKVIFIDNVIDSINCRETSIVNVDDIQCCPELPELQTENFPSHCEITGFQGTPITAIRSDDLGNFGAGYGLIFNPLNVFEEFLGYYQGNQNFPLVRKITFEIEAVNILFVPNNISNVTCKIKWQEPYGFGNYYNYWANYASNFYFDDVEITDLTDVTLQLISGSPEINSPQTIKANFSGQGHLPEQARLYMPDAYLMWYDNGEYRTEIIGDIDEVLTLKKEHNAYYGSVQNYYMIPGRISIGVNHYPKLNSNFKFPRGGNYVSALSPIDPYYYWTAQKRDPEDFPLLTYAPPLYLGSNILNETTFRVYVGKVNGYGNANLGDYWFDSRIKTNTANAVPVPVSEMNVTYSYWTSTKTGQEFKIISKHPNCFFSSLEV